nr:MAG TPA: hypothetical protein [Caudoviricetes sp.]
MSYTTRRCRSRHHRQGLSIFLFYICFCLL